MDVVAGADIPGSVGRDGRSQEQRPGRSHNAAHAGCNSGTDERALRGWERKHRKPTAFPVAFANFSKRGEIPNRIRKSSVGDSSAFDHVVAFFIRSATTSTPFA